MKRTGGKKLKEKFIKGWKTLKKQRELQLFAWIGMIVLFIFSYLPLSGIIIAFKDYKIQMQGVAIAPENTQFNREDWKLAVDSSILSPQLAWEGKCIEGASIIRKKNKLYMFYAGSYNNAPQQIGVAVSKDGITWKRLSDEPFLRNGKPGEWNSSESGHPHIFADKSGRSFLFFQGNNDNGKSWYISNIEVFWEKGKPYLKD